jgi:ketosteroid isomerase-like protein
MKILTAVTLLAAVVVVPCFSQASVPADLKTAMKQRADALAHADATTWGRYTADNFVVVGGNGAVQTKAERIAQIKAGNPNGPSSVEHETVQMYGTTALQRVQSAKDGIWVTFVWSKDPKGWRVVFAQVTPIYPDSAAVRHAIDEDNARFIESFKRGDAAGLASHYADGAVVMLANGPAWDGTAAIKQGFTEFLGNVSVPNMQLTTHDIIIDPGYAIERGAYEMTFHPKSGAGSDITDKGKYITVWEQQLDGSWKIIRDISNSDNPLSK